MWFVQLCLSGKTPVKAGDRLDEKDRACKQKEKMREVSKIE